ncbi:LysR family transcriptional regulator [Actinoalloteichus caeruleus]|uniref:LysR family transcriptional regulator n=1 Tax=Actinoalloteichus cyanogriseus TaxID=2893586 RepID=UPI0004AA5879|nr:LysR family transcriptional regulator [Actinoalloteichus caeruleus]
MHQANLHQIECLLTLAEELHFGRTAERLGYSQSRVSQLVAELERRLGVRLVERTSRRVALTRFGVQFVDEVRPAYEELTAVYSRARDRARRRELRELRVGFHGDVYEEITEAFRSLRAEHGVSMALSEVPLGSPFTAVVEGRVDAAVVELPCHEAALTVGYRFPPQDRLLAVSTNHPLARRTSVTVEELAEWDVVRPLGDAPDYWMAARVPRATPAGLPISSSVAISTIHEGLATVAGGEHVMLVCRPLADRAARRDVRFLPVAGMEASSQLGLVWRRDRGGDQLVTLARLLRTAFTVAPAGARAATAAEEGPGRSASPVVVG